MKKVLSVFLSVVFCFSCVAAAQADDEFIIDGSGTLTEYRGDADRVVVPEGVKTLGDGCLSDKKMTELVLPDSLESIGDFALSWNENLKSVTLPKSVSKLGCYVFEGCVSLTAVSVAQGNTCFKSVDGVLFDQSGEKLILFPSAKPVTSYRIPDTVKTIEDGAFFLTNLTEITMGDSVETIGSWAFAKCHALTAVSFGKNVRSLGGYVFSTCDKLQSVTLPAALKEIGEEAFECCPALQAVNVEEGSTAFAAQDGVLYTKDGTTLIKFPEGKSAKGFTLPASVTKLAVAAMARCDITSVDLTGVADIPNYALYECKSLRSVSLGAGLTRVGDGAFGFDTMLRDVYYEGSSADWKKVEIQNNNGPLNDAQKHFEGGIVFPEAREVEIQSLPEDAAVPDIDTSEFSFNAGYDGGSTTGIFRYAFGQTFGFDSYFTLVTGPKGGEMLVNFPINDADDAYRFTVKPCAAYRLTYSYGFSSAGTGYNDSKTVEWFFSTGRSGSQAVSVNGGSLRRGYLTVTLLRQDEPPAHEHDWEEPTYKWSKDNGSVTAVRVCRDDDSHVETETVRTTVTVVAAACEKAGKTTYTATFANPAFAVQTKDVSIPAAGHDWGEPTYTWSADNRTVTAVCICRTDAGHRETETVGTLSAVTPAACEKAGNTTYTAPFTKPVFTKQIKDVPIPATGHDWGTPTYTWSADNSAVTAVCVCRKDANHKATETVKITAAVTPASCLQEGKATYTAVFTAPAFTPQTKEVPIPATGHDWGEPTYTWSADNSTVTAECVCRTDAKHKVTETVKTTAAVTPASCLQEGKATYTAVFTDPAFIAREKDVPIPTTGHDWGEPTYTWSADNSAVTAVRVCRADESHKETETVNTVGKAGADRTTYTAVFTNPAFANQTKDAANGAERLPGDVDGDGKVTSADARLALRASVHLTNEPGDVTEGTEGYQAADYDKNGKVESSDARCILRVSVKLDPFG